MSGSPAAAQEALSPQAIYERGRRLRALKVLFTTTRINGRRKPDDPAQRALAMQQLKQLDTEQLLGLIVEARSAGLI